MTWGRAAAVALLLAPVVVVGCGPTPPDGAREPGAAVSAEEPAVAGLAVDEPEVQGLAAAAPGPGPDDAPAARGLPPAPAIPAAAPAEAVPMYTATVAPVDEALAARMSASWRPGCPVPLEDLRYVTVTYVDFDGAVQTGELVVHADVAEGVTRVFARLFELRYPIRSMRLVDDFGADDDASMRADNTSAFNCRAITGGSAWSEHAYGRAIDLNPVENPYVLGSHVAPRVGRPFVSRPDAPGVVHADDAVVRAFAAEGWQWGGYWDSPTDYQHFSTTGR